jgi:hypothetical protein
MSDHELRKDFNGARRQVREVPPLIWSPYASGEPPEALDRRGDEDEEEEKRLRQIELERIKALIEVAAENRNFKLMDAYEAHVEGARRNAAAHKLFQHAFLQFPTDIEITPKSEREMLAQGVAFINRTYGGNAVFHARLDRDERGRHGVDVFFAPRYAKTTAKGTEDWISLSKFSKELARDRFGQRQKTVKNPKTKKFEPVFDKKTGKPVMVWNDSGYFQGRALQDAFFEHLRDDMGLKWAVRGERKKTRDDDWKTPEEIGAEKDLQRAREEAAEAKAFIADAERIADTHWDRASAAMDALSAAAAQKQAVEREAAQIRDKALREAQEAAERASEAIQEEIEAQLAPKKFVLKPPTVKREGDPAPQKPPERPYRALVSKLLTEARERIQAALQASPEAQDVRAAISQLERIKERETRAMVERRRELERTARQVEENKQQGNKLLSGESRLAQWHSFVEVMKDKARTIFGEAGYQRLAEAVNEEWKNHPDNLTKPPHQPEPPKPSGPSGGFSP